VNAPRRHPNAASTQDSARFRRAFATHGASAGSDDTGAPPRRHARLIFTTACASLIATGALLGTSATASATAADTCPNAALRAESLLNPETGLHFSAELPDCRAFEQVSPSSGQEVYIPTGSHFYIAEEDINTERPFRVAADGTAVAYIADPDSSAEGGSGSTGFGSGNQYLAKRTEAGWSAANIQPLDTSLATTYQAFSDDLSLGILSTVRADPLLTPDAVEKCRDLYSRASADGEYHALFTETQTPGFCGEEPEPLFAGASADHSHLLFQTGAPLTPDAEEAPGEGHDNLYDSTGGSLRLVNVLPGASPEPDPNATFGAPDEGEARFDFSNVVSADGSRVFWTDLSTGIVYLRLNGAQEQSALDGSGECTEAAKACTVPVSTGEARFWTATPDGRYAYYTENGELWRYDSENETRQVLAGPGSEVQGVIGVNEAGEAGAYLYFVADGVLASNKVDNGNGEEEAQAGQPNLYLRHGGATSFIASLSPRDNAFDFGGSGEHLGDWQPALGFRTARLSPNGTHLGFRSIRPLTGYDNLNATQCTLTGGACPEIFVYAAGPAQLSCASCDPSGAPPASVPSAESGGEVGALVPASLHNAYMPRWISDDGSVFFETNQALDPSDDNGYQDVYQWEQEGEGSCEGGSEVNGGACVYLLSGGASADASFLVDTSADASDVFFTTRAQLVRSDRDQLTALYDARVDGGFPAAEAVICESGEACGGPGTEAAASQSPGTSTFSGPGNPPPPVRCRKATIRKRGRCVSKKRHKSTKHPKKHKRAAGRSHGGQK